MSDETQPTSAVIAVGYADVAEFLHNLIQDAQASGAIVHVVTIVPAAAVSGAEEVSSLARKSCQPSAASCPKGNQ